MPIEGNFGTCLFDTTVSPNVLMFQAKILVFFLADGKETVAWVFLDNAVFWQISWFTLGVVFYLSKEVDSLWFTTTQRDFSLVQVVGYTFRVSVFVSHKFLYLL